MEAIVKDIAVGSFLLCSERVRLVRTERRNEKLVLFYFAPKEEAEKLINDYWSDSVSVSPRKLFASQRSLKDLIFSGGPA